MDEAKLKRRLRRAGFFVIIWRRLPTDLGTQYRLNNGAIVNLFDSGAANVQGVNVDVVKKALKIPGKKNISGEREALIMGSGCVR